MYVHMYVCMSPSALHRVHTAGDLSHQCKPFSKVSVITDYWFTDEGGRIVNWTSDLVCKSLGLCVSKLIMRLQLTVRVCVVIAGLLSKHLGCQWTVQVHLNELCYCSTNGVRPSVHQSPCACIICLLQGAYAYMYAIIAIRVHPQALGASLLILNAPALLSPASVWGRTHNFGIVATYVLVRCVYTHWYRDLWMYYTKQRQWTYSCTIPSVVYRREYIVKTRLKCI